jgi:hypothetical protein
VYPQIPPQQSLVAVAEQLLAQFEAGKSCGLALAAVGVPPPAIQALCNAAPALGIELRNYL